MDVLESVGSVGAYVVGDIVCVLCVVFLFKQKAAYDIEYGLVGSESCIRDSRTMGPTVTIPVSQPVCIMAKMSSNEGSVGLMIGIVVTVSSVM